jgi:hypothetical protein
MGLSQTMTDAELNIKRRISFLRVKYRQSLPMAENNVKKKLLLLPFRGAGNFLNLNYNEATFLESPANPNRDVMPCKAKLPP